MTGMIHGAPLVVLRPEFGGPQAERVERVRRYLRRRADRVVREERRIARRLAREGDRPVPCALCGARTEPWQRARLPRHLVICGGHSAGMWGFFPFRRESRHAEIPNELRDLLYVARVTLYAFERTIRTMEMEHG